MFVLIFVGQFPSLCLVPGHCCWPLALFTNSQVLAEASRRSDKRQPSFFLTDFLLPQAHMLNYFAMVLVPAWIVSRQVARERKEELGQGDER